MALVVAALIVPLPAQKLDVDLQRAIQKETVTGDLKAAIEEYKKIVARAGSDRSVAAKALVHMAEAYQKLGDTESRKIYERVVRDYADQKELATLAGTRLGSERSERHPEVVLRKLGAVDSPASVSSDGRYMTWIDWSSDSTANWGRLFVRDLHTRADRQLTDRKVGHAYDSKLSRDGAHVAYLWWNSSSSPDFNPELRVASLSGTGLPPSRRLYTSDDLDNLRPLDWSPDGKSIAVHLTRKDKTGQLALISFPGGALSVLKSVDWQGPGTAVFSPDGRDLAFGLNGRVFVLATDGSRETPAPTHRSQESLIGWTPDGNHLLVLSDRGGTPGMWALPFADRKPRGEPQLIKADAGYAMPLGVTKSGAIYLATDFQRTNIEIATIDTATGKEIGPPSTIQDHVGYNREPTWSPDGKRLAYVSLRDGKRILGIWSAETGEVRELRPAVVYMQGLSWAPDGRYFACFATDTKGREGVIRIDAQTGEVSAIVVPVPERLSYEGIFWSPDGSKIYYHSQKGSIYETDLASGSSRTIARGYGVISLSPDGRWIATTTQKEPGVNAVVLVPVGGGQNRELLTIRRPNWINNSSKPWTPDGRAILVRKMLDQGGRSSELWRVSVDGGEPRKLDFDANRVITYAQGKTRISPDGRHLAYVSNGGGSEVWVLENFLPPPKTRK
jgi:Tol biopolymer transport system component